MSKAPTVVITGCSDGGLGAALAIELHTAGYRVFATARNLSKMANLPQEVERFALDVTSKASIKACCTEISNRTGGTLSMLINNSGVWHTMPFPDVDTTAARSVFDVNFWGQLDTTQGFLPLLLESQKRGQKTTVVLVTSLAGASPTPFSSIYGASKAAADYVFNTLRMELQPWNINVVNLKTGAVRSNMTSNRVVNSVDKPKLPPGSLFQVAREKVERFMEGNSADAGVPAEEWASMVVKHLNKPTPPQYIWGGTYSTAAWVMQFIPLPASMLQGMVLNITGMTDVSKAVAEAKSQK